MIRIEYTGKCKNCKCAELELEEVVMDPGNWDGEVLKEYEIRCIHEDACANIAERITREAGFDRT